jgi:hypothetical protein
LPPDSAPQQSLLQLHIAEYQMLTNRSTYYIYIGTTIWSILLLFFGVTAPMQKWSAGGPPALVWLVCYVAQFSFLMWTDNLHNQYRNLEYIENHLRPKIVALITDSSFWHYEQYLHRIRVGKPQWWELYPKWAGLTMAVAAITFRGYIIVARGHFWLANGWDVAAGLGAILLGIGIFRKSNKVRALRQMIFAATA